MEKNQKKNSLRVLTSHIIGSLGDVGTLQLGGLSWKVPHFWGIFIFEVFPNRLKNTNMNVSHHSFEGKVFLVHCI